MRRMALLLAVATATLGARFQRPDFTGEWVLDRGRTVLQYPQLAQLDGGVVRIAHTDTLFSFSRRFFLAGQRDTVSYTLTPGAAEVRGDDGPRQTYERLYWSADTLVFVSRIVAPQGVAVDSVWYRLLDGGRALEARERFRAPRLRYDNLWVFSRGPDLDSLARQVRESERAFAATMAARDLRAFGTFVADEALFFGRTVLRGREAIVAGWGRYFEGAAAPFSWEPGTVDVLDSGTMAMSSGPVRDPTGKIVGTFSSVWRRESDGRWRVVFDKGCDVCNCTPAP